MKGADFVIISIEVGNRFKLWDQDWMIPFQYGIPQVYGENGGAGGLFHHCAPQVPEPALCRAVPRNCLARAISAAHARRVPFSELELRAAGLNHFSVLVSARYRTSGKDTYPDILAKAPVFFEKVLGYSDILEYIQTTGNIPRTEGETGLPDIGRTESSRAWSDRGLFRHILERFHLLPITSDSHIGEYIQWAHEVADHKGILDFYMLYRASLSMLKPTIELKVKERVVPIIEGILGDTGYEEAAVNIINTGFIPSLPESIVVEVPARVWRKGFEGIAFPDYPKGFAALLRNYIGVYVLTAEGILQKSKDLAIQALLVNPVVTTCACVPELVDVMIERQAQWLGYLK